MNIGIWGSAAQFELWQQKTSVALHHITSIDDIAKYDAVFCCLPVLTDTDKAILQKAKLAFLNDVLHKTTEFAIFNGWPTFLERNILEVSRISTLHQSILASLNIPFVTAPAEAGMLTPKVLSMIINEAYFTLEEAVSSKEEIDTAMKLGTSYPLGPFEWSKKIGLSNIASLLQLLADKDERYVPSRLLITEAAEE
jgi:hypothetical protein